MADAVALRATFERSVGSSPSRPTKYIFITYAGREEPGGHRRAYTSGTREWFDSITPY